MSPDYPLDYEPATQGYVLAVLRTSFPTLTRDTALDDFLLDADESATNARHLSKLFNQAFHLQVPTSDWWEAFPAISNRTVGDLCDFLAQHARRPVIRPWRHVSGESLPAGAFLTVRSILTQFGAKPDEITPSVPLKSVLPWYSDRLIWELQLLSPGNLPRYSETRPVQTIGCAVFGLSVVAGFLGVVLGRFGFANAALSLTGLTCFGIALGFLLHFLGSALPPRRVSFGDLHTFRDLAYALVGQKPRRRIQPSA